MKTISLENLEYFKQKADEAYEKKGEGGGLVKGIASYSLEENKDKTINSIIKEMAAIEASIIVMYPYTEDILQLFLDLDTYGEKTLADADFTEITGTIAFQRFVGGNTTTLFYVGTLLGEKTKDAVYMGTEVIFAIEVSDDTIKSGQIIFADYYTILSYLTYVLQNLRNLRDGDLTTTKDGAVKATTLAVTETATAENVTATKVTAETIKADYIVGGKEGGICYIGGIEGGKVEFNGYFGETGKTNVMSVISNFVVNMKAQRPAYFYTLPAATTSALGGVIAGTNLAVASDGTLDVAESLLARITDLETKVAALESSAS